MNWDSLDLIELARKRVQAFTPVGLPLAAWAPAAVLLLLFRTAGTEHILLTVRSNTVEHHKGQISFPGGAVHEADRDLEVTALRETYEEVGLEPEHIEVVGRLNDMVTNSRFRVTPVVGILHGAPPEYIPSIAEVAEVLEVPLRHLLNPASHVDEQREREGEVYILPGYQFGTHRIWGATARILTDFLRLLEADSHGDEGSGAL